jgi:hypothetical protein
VNEKDEPDEALWAWDETVEEEGKREDLSEDARRQFSRMLRHLTLERNKIAATMAFAIDHTNAADEVRTSTLFSSSTHEYL